MKTETNLPPRPVNLVSLIPTDLRTWLPASELARAAREAAETYYWLEADEEDHTPFGGCACPLRKLATLTYCYAAGTLADDLIALEMVEDPALRSLTGDAVFTPDKLRLFRAHNTELIKLCLARVLELAWRSNIGEHAAGRNLCATEAAFRIELAWEAARPAAVVVKDDADDEIETAPAVAIPLRLVLPRLAAAACAVLAFLNLSITSASYAQNLVSNPHFDAGTNSFQCDYLHSPARLNAQGTFAISNNPARLNSFFVSFRDHTSTNGLMLIVNGEENPPVPTNAVWRQTVPARPHRFHRFSVWVANACCTSGGNPGQIALVINGTNLSGPLQPPSPAGTWMEHSVVWDSGESSSATLEVRIPTTFGSGNDFALDDFSFVQIDVPSQGLIGPLPYRSRADSPFNHAAFGWFHLEDWEQHGLFTPGVTMSGVDLRLGSSWARTSIDSVDADDGLINGRSDNGAGRYGDNQWACGPTGIRFNFDAEVLGTLPTHVGIVWTDGFGLIRFEAFDRHGRSLGVLTGNHADANYFGGTAEDRFYGAIHLDGISAIHIASASGGIEVDHLQYGATLRLSIALRDGQPVLQWPSSANRFYQVQYTASLTAPAWLDLGAPKPGTGNINTLINDASGQDSRFYRLIELRP